MWDRQRFIHTHTADQRWKNYTSPFSRNTHTFAKNILVNAGKKTLIGINTALWVKFQQAIYVERLFVSSFTVNVNFEAVWLYTDKKKHNFLSHTVWLTHEHWDCAASFVTSALQLNQTNISHFILKQPTGNGSIQLCITSNREISFLEIKRQNSLIYK